MRRWIVGCFIASYLSALGFGLACQTVGLGTSRHPAMYFVVWDMYCAWAAYNHSYRAVAEGVSGTFYDLNPAPWGAFRPFNTLDRLQSIGAAGNQARFTRLVAANTKHEPLARMFVIEEAWAKQFDLPEYIWKAFNAIPRSPYRYTKVVLEQSGDGEITAAYSPWLDTQTQIMLADNPRIKQEIRSSVPFWQIQQTSYESNQDENTMEVMGSPGLE
jgi:hypothetical protein